jgi:hypothetical protein
MRNYDILMNSNRAKKEELSLGKLAQEDNQGVREYLEKQAGLIPDSLEKTASHMTKEAFLSRGLDLFDNTKNLIAQRLGVSDGMAHELSSRVITHSDRIQNRFQGDQGKIIEGIVDAMGSEVATNPGSLKSPLGMVNMRMSSNKDLTEYIKNRLVEEVMLSPYEADRLKLSIIKQAGDLTTVLRPYNKQQIADAIVNMIKDRNNPSLAYEIKDSKILVEGLRAYLK